MDAVEIECANCTENVKGHGAADRNCPTYLKEKGKLHEHIPENKYRFFPTNNPHMWQLLNQLEGYTNNQECAWQQGADWAAAARNAWADEVFTNNWKTIWHHGRQPTANEQNQDREHYEQHQNRERYEEYTRTRDGRWLTRPIQTSIDNYFGTAKSYNKADDDNQPWD